MNGALVLVPFLLLATLARAQDLERCALERDLRHVGESRSPGRHDRHRPYPFTQTVNTGATTSFSAAAGSGFPLLVYHWTHNDKVLLNGTGPHGSTISGATTQVLTISNIALADQGAYKVIVLSACGMVTSQAGTLNVDVTSGTSSEARISIFHAIGPNPTGGESTLDFSPAEWCPRALLRVRPAWAAGTPGGTGATAGRAVRGALGYARRKWASSWTGRLCSPVAAHRGPFCRLPSTYLALCH
ncbi:MAG: immunoglobulin domain-containing protein [bacterium]|nr:immunoglobulin domain-containing protein [bacterium]